MAEPDAASAASFADRPAAEARRASSRSGDTAGTAASGWSGGWRPAANAAQARDLDWLLDDLADRVSDFRRAVILSRDGLLIAASADLGREDAEHLSAVAAAVQSLAAGTGERFRAGRVRQTVIELEQGIFFLIAAGEGTCLAALCPPDADAGAVAYEMAMLAKRARPHLAALPRRPAAGMSAT